MRISDVYTTFGIPPNLQQHMLRVAALAKCILDGWKGPSVHAQEIIQVCLLHDIAKPIDFDLSRQSAFISSPDEVAKLKKTQQRLKDTYGSHEHTATCTICKEVGLNTCALSLMKACEWKNMETLIKENKVEYMIPIYCDMRIGPVGILSLEERMQNLRSRTPVSSHQELLQAGKRAERIMQDLTTTNITKIQSAEIEDKTQEMEKQIVA